MKILAFLALSIAASVSYSQNAPISLKPPTPVGTETTTARPPGPASAPSAPAPAQAVSASAPSTPMARRVVLTASVVNQELDTALPLASCMAKKVDGDRIKASGETGFVPVSRGYTSLLENGVSLCNGTGSEVDFGKKGTDKARQLQDPPWSQRLAAITQCKKQALMEAYYNLVPEEGKEPLGRDTPGTFYHDLKFEAGKLDYEKSASNAVYNGHDMNWWLAEIKKAEANGDRINYEEFVMEKALREFDSKLFASDYQPPLKLEGSIQTLKENLEMIAQSDDSAKLIEQRLKKNSPLSESDLHFECTQHQLMCEITKTHYGREGKKITIGEAQLKDVAELLRRARDKKSEMQAQLKDLQDRMAQQKAVGNPIQTVKNKIGDAFEKRKHCGETEKVQQMDQLLGAIGQCSAQSKFDVSPKNAQVLNEIAHDDIILGTTNLKAEWANGNFELAYGLSATDMKNIFCPDRNSKLASLSVADRLYNVAGIAAKNDRPQAKALRACLEEARKSPRTTGSHLACAADRKTPGTAEQIATPATGGAAGSSDH